MDKDTVENLKRLANTLYGDDRVDEGLLVDELLADVERIDGLLKKGPVCPVCKTRMIRERFKGFYDQFDYWGCQCDDGDVPVEEVHHGQYG